MNVRAVGSNRLAITFDNGVKVLFSYDVPVAVYVPGTGYCKTDGFVPPVSQRHIKAWAGGEAADLPSLPHATVVAYLNAGTGHLEAPGYTKPSHT